MALVILHMHFHINTLYKGDDGIRPGGGVTVYSSTKPKHGFVCYLPVVPQMYPHEEV